MAKKTSSLKWYNYVLMVVFTLGALFGGIPKFIPNPQGEQMMAAVNLSPYFMYFLGICWIAAAVGIWFTKTRVWAALGTLPILCGAIMAVIAVGMFEAIGMLVGYVIVSLLVLWQENFFKKVAA